MANVPILVANVHKGQTITHVSTLSLDGDEDLEIGKAVLLDTGSDPYLEGTVVGYSEGFYYVRID